MTKKMKRIDRLVEEKIAKYPETAPFLRFYLKLRKKLEDLSGLINPAAEYEKGEAEKRLRKSMPVFRIAEWKIMEAEADDVVQKLCRFLKRENEEIADKVEAIRQCLKKRDWKTGAFVEAALQGNEDFLEKLAEKYALDYHTLYLLWRCAAKTFIIPVKKAVDPWLTEMEWNESVCPACGSEPVMAELRGEEGFRYLYCAFCRHEWLWKRMICPFCKNEDGKKMKYFYIEKDAFYRVNVCLACKRYIKTVDSREFANKPMLEIEAAGTVHLDIKAESEGYERSLPIEAMFL